MRLPKRPFDLASLLAVGCLVLSAGQVSADESPWYVATSLGQAETEVRFGSRHTKWIADENQAAAFALGYAINRHLAVQAGYHDLGSHEGFGSPCREESDSCIERLATLRLCVEGSQCAQVLVGLDARLSGFSLAAVPHWPVSERFTVRGKVGVMAWDSEITGAAGVGRIEDFSGESLVLGVGFQYDFLNRFSLLLDYDELDLDVRSAALGVSWQF